jgi:hypothetical protein
MRPDERPKKLTRRSASPKGKVFKMMASVSLAGILCRRADCASLPAYKQEAERKREIKFLTTRFPVAQLSRALFLNHFWRTLGRLWPNRRRPFSSRLRTAKIPRWPERNRLDTAFHNSSSFVELQP